MKTATDEKTLIEDRSIRKAALVLKAINHPLRQQMLKLIDRGKQMTVTDLYLTLNLEQAVASQHLARLRLADLVITKREGKFVFYSVNYDRLRGLHDVAAKLIHQKS